MAPLKAINSNPPTNGIMTRSKSIGTKDLISNKRKAIESPEKRRTIKRAAFGELTNLKNQENFPTHNVDAKKTIEPKKGLRNVNINIPQKANSVLKAKAIFETSNKGISSRLPPIPAIPRPRSTIAKAVLKKVSSFQNQENKVVKKDLIEKKTKNVTVEKKTRSSFKIQCTTIASTSKSNSSSSNNETTKQEQSSEPSLYESAIEEINEVSKIETNEEKQEIPDGVELFDTEDDPNAVSNYAMEIFNYLKSREEKFPIIDYMGKQPDITPWMRALLIDWMVEVQENFELNHETLYLAVKLVDLYLNKVLVAKESLQLIGAASLFISCKYDERIPPLVEDFLYICDGAYTHSSLVKMEIKILKAIDFDLGIPLSYRFLRRYARTSKMSMPTLTLARYILECSLMDYSLTSWSDSKLAAASLYLAMKMKNISDWTPTLEYYTSYTKQDMKEYVFSLNNMLHKPQKESLGTIRKKYSHKIFFEVANLPLLNNSDLDFK